VIVLQQNVKEEWQYYKQLWTVPGFRQLVTGPSLRRPRFDPRPVHVGSVLAKVALEQVFPPISIISPTTHTHSFLYHLYYITLASNSNINNTPKKIKGIMNIGFRKPVPLIGKYILPNSKSIRALQAIMDKSQHITHKMNQSTNRTLIVVHKWKSLFVIYQQRIHKFLKLKIKIILYTVTSPSGSCMATSVSCPSV